MTVTFFSVMTMVMNVVEATIYCLTSSLILILVILLQQKSKTRDRAREEGEEGEGVLLAKQGSAHGRVVEVGLIRESRQVLVLPSGSRSLRSPQPALCHPAP